MKAKFIKYYGPFIPGDIIDVEINDPFYWTKEQVEWKDKKVYIVMPKEYAVLIP